MRTVLVLGRWAERVIDDNLVNKPSSSLSAIFRSWMPQTSADLEARKKALSKLAETFPAVAWPILIEQFERGARMGHFSHKPRWRPDGHGYGNVVTRWEGNEFAMHALQTALAWPNHTLSTISDLVESLDGLDDSLRPQVWDVVDGWIKTADDADRAALREKIRVSTFTRRALRRRKREDERGVDERARCIRSA